MSCSMVAMSLWSKVPVLSALSIESICIMSASIRLSGRTSGTTGAFRAPITCPTSAAMTSGKPVGILFWRRFFLVDRFFEELGLLLSDTKSSVLGLVLVSGATGVLALDSDNGTLLLLDSGDCKTVSAVSCSDVAVGLGEDDGSCGSSASIKGWVLATSPALVPMGAVASVADGSDVLASMLTDKLPKALK